MCRSMVLVASLWALFFAAVPAPGLGDSIVVSGTVRPAGGAVLEGAGVELLPLPGNFAWARAVLEDGQVPAEPVARAAADGHGRFRLEAPRPGVFTVLISAPGFVPVRYFPLALTSSVELPQAVLLPDEGTRIEVRSAAGGPVPGTWVMAVATRRSFWAAAGDGWSVASRIGRSSGDGVLTLPRAAGESLEVFALPADQPPVRRSGVEREARFVVEPASAAASVIRVHDPEGKPVAGLVGSVGALAWPVGRTGEDGLLALTGQGSSSVRLHLLAADGRRRSLEVELTAPGGEGVPVLFPSPAVLAGRVVDAGAGEPLPGALVWTGHDPGDFTLSDTRGRFQLPVPDAERFWVQAEASGFLPRKLDVQPGPDGVPRELVLALPVAAAAAGRVVDGEGRAVAGAHLEARIVPPEARPKVFRLAGTDSLAWSDAAGEFLLSGLESGMSYEVTASRPGFVSSRLTLKMASTPPEEGFQSLHVELVRARRGFGRVVDGGLQPLSEVRIEVSASGEAGEASRATTDGTGRFELAAVPGRVVDVEAEKAGFTSLTVRRIEVAEGAGAVDLGTLVLIPGARLEGRVMSRDGEPLAEASVWITDDVGQARLAENLLRREKPAAVTGEEGRFLIEDLQPERRVHLLLDREGFLSATVLGVEIPSPAPVEVSLRPASTVSGQVTAETGEGIAGARLSVQGRDLPEGLADVRRGPEEGGSAVSDAEGRFVVSGLEPGEAVLEVSASGFQPPPLVEIEIPDGGSVEGLQVVLERGAVLVGRVTSRRGEAVSAARVLLDRLSARSDAEGRYRIDGVPLGGPRTIEIRHPGYEPESRQLEVAPGENVADFVLTGGWEAAGRVADEGGLGVAGASLRLLRRGAGFGREYRAVSDAEGRFLFPDVVAGRYTLEAEKAGYAAAELPDAVEVAERSVGGLEVVLRRGTTVTGRVLGLSFEELAVVKVEGELGHRSQPGTVDFEGRYEVADLGPGDWLLRAWLAGGSREVQARVAVEAGTLHLTRDLEFAGGVTLTGHVLYAGEALAGTQVTAMSFERSVERSVVSDREGSFRLEDLKPGRYRLGLTNPREMVTHYEDVDLEADRDLVIEIATARVSGRLVSAATSEPVAGAIVYFQKLLGDEGTEPGPLLTVGTSPEGSFTVTRVAAGRHRLTVRKEGYTPYEEIVEVAQGEELELPLELEPSAGLELRVRLASGASPEYATVHVYEPSSGPWRLSQTRYLDASGVTRFDTVPAGSWDVLVAAPGGVAVRVPVSVPRPPLEVVLQPATRIEVRVPALVASNRGALVTLQDPQGEPFTAVDPGTGARQQQWNLVAGVGAVEGVPAGTWTLRVTASDGQLWQENVVTSQEERIAVSLR